MHAFVSRARRAFVFERNVMTLSGSVFILLLCMYSWYPILALHLRSLGATDAQVGLTYTIQALGFAVPQLAAGLFSDRWGRKWLVALPTFGFGVAYMLMAVAKTWAGVTACLFLVTAMQAIQRPSFTSMLAESVPESRRGKAFGTFEFAVTFGATIGPFVGALLLPRVGVPALMFGSGIVSMIAGAMRAIGLREHHIEPVQARMPLRIGSAVRMPSVVWYIVVAGGLVMLNNLTLNGPFVSLHAHDVQGLGDSQVNLLYAIGGIGSVLAALAAGRLVDRLGGRITMAGAAVSAAALVLVWAVIGPGAAGYITFVLASGFVEAAIVCHSAVVCSLAERRSRATVVGVVGTISGIIGALSPTVGAALRTAWGSAAPFWAAAILALVIAVSLSRVRTTNEGRSGAVPLETSSAEATSPGPGAG